MVRVYLKCNYERTPNELAPETECPQCGPIYAKVEKALRPPGDPVITFNRAHGNLILRRIAV